MEVLERKQRTREQTRTGIVTTAKDIARREGWQSVSIRKIAEAINYSPPIVYEYFDSKDVLLDEIRKEGFRFLHLEYDRINKLYRDPEKRLYEISMVQWDFAMKHREVYQVMYNLDGAFCTIPVHESYEAQAVSQLIQGIIFAFIPKSKESISRIFFEWWSISHGMIALAMMLKEQQCLDQSQQIYQESMRRFARSLK